MSSFMAVAGSLARQRVGLALLLAGSLWAPPRSLAGQEAPSAAKAPPWFQLTIVQVQPTMVDEYMAVQRELMARAQKAKTPWRTVSRTEVFGDTYRFFIATPLENLASLDRGNDSDPELTALVNRLRRCITSRNSYAIRNLPEISNPLPEGRRPDLMVINVARIAPGREQDYLNVMRTDFLPHFDEVKIHHVTGALAFGGESGFIHVFYVDNFAELDKGSPVMRELGAEGAQAATAKLSGIVTSSELWVARLIPELSYGPTPEESAKR
ncbi:MAG TPA: hypothetical protein VEK15_06415 [Vicinamibacteria bacterium]|nr:hypothetical protein [Vicinamibacteria bacterium]